jgi:hypothetical protein
MYLLRTQVCLLGVYIGTLRFFFHNQSAVLQVDFSYLAACLTADSPTIRSNHDWWELLIFV